MESDLQIMLKDYLMNIGNTIASTVNIVSTGRISNDDTVVMIAGEGA